MATKTLRVNFTFPEDVVTMLKTRVNKRRRSAFVAEATREKLREIEEEQLRQELIEGYKARREEDAELNKEWEYATLESWPE